MKKEIFLLLDNLKSIENDFNESLVDNSISFKREIEFTAQALSKNKLLLEVALSDISSLKSAIKNIGAIGVSLNPAKKQAYLVPREGRVNLDISYMGLIDLAIQGGSIRWVKAEIVREKDQFMLVGLDKAPIHNFSPFSTDRGDIVGVYAVSKNSDGEYLTELMSVEEVNEIRDRLGSFSSSGKSIWETDYSEMARKTVIKRACKYWRPTDRLANAIHVLNNESGEGFKLNDNKIHSNKITEEPVSENLDADDKIISQLEKEASKGLENFNTAWSGLSIEARKKIGAKKKAEIQKIAKKGGDKKESNKKGSNKKKVEEYDNPF